MFYEFVTAELILKKGKITPNLLIFITIEMVTENQ